MIRVFETVPHYAFLWRAQREVQPLVRVQPMCEPSIWLGCVRPFAHSSMAQQQRWLCHSVGHGVQGLCGVSASQSLFTFGASTWLDVHLWCAVRLPAFSICTHVCCSPGFCGWQGGLFLSRELPSSSEGVSQSSMRCCRSLVVGGWWWLAFRRVLFWDTEWSHVSLSSRASHASGAGLTARFGGILWSMANHYCCQHDAPLVLQGTR